MICHDSLTKHSGTQYAQVRCAQMYCDFGSSLLLCTPWKSYTWFDRESCCS